MQKRTFYIIAVILCLFLGACGVDKKADEESLPSATLDPVESVVSETEESISTEDTEKDTEPVVPVLYDGDEQINLYLLRYNELHTDNSIESEDFVAYHHHGTTHKNQIIFNEGEVQEVIISSLASGKMEVSVENASSTDAYKVAFISYALVYDLDLTEEMLEGYWESALENVTAFTEFDEFELYIRSFNGEIEYIQISGEMV